MVAGRTAVKLSSELVGALTSLNVSVSPLNQARVYNGVASFPVSGGIIDLNSGKSEIAHSGGLEFSAGNTKVDLLNFSIEVTGGQPILTGAVVANGTFVGRITLFTLTAPTNLSLPVPNSDGGFVHWEGIGVYLSGDAANALNGAFGVSAFKAGIPVGTANTRLLVSEIGECGQY